ncbi:hypothetical protein BJ875DRAFT_489300 [Amylocarpus encephaloides]|uniref:Peroxidase n=1 Tax=Amylocarpus encephaloides TaxID=45428 RepID=A0A9P8C0N1_9HELO|nr:hypothetical protein BJ875DRAFT_489300 [Amylocarpus encephaloides]
MFKDKDFDDKDLAALMGAHCVSKAFGTPNITSGTSQDTTPGKWGVNYYAEIFKAKSGMTASQVITGGGEAGFGKDLVWFSIAKSTSFK